MDFSQVSIDQLVIHHVGCKAEGEEIKFSRSLYQIHDDEIVGNVLINYFFKSFKNEAYYNFFDENELQNNKIFQVVSRMFDDPGLFYTASLEIANHLFDISTHPMIKGGEFYMAYFHNCYVEGEMVDAIGIFKSENKETFLKVFLKDQSFEIGTQEGISVKRLDKGCLIFNTDQESGYKVLSVDNVNKGNEALFWRDEFLCIKPREDNYYFTNNYLKLCREFVGDVFNSENEVPRADQIDMLNRSIDFFNKRDSFSQKEFDKEVIRQPEVLDAFNEYKSFFENEKAIPLKSEFDISKSAVKSEKKFFKSILKLDKNFHVYIHGKRNYIEKGYDESKGLNYYKLFYEVEH